MNKLNKKNLPFFLETGVVLLGLILVFAILSMNFLEWKLIIGISLLLFITYVFSFLPRVGLILVTLLMPYWGLEFLYGSINVPYVDLFGLCLILAIAVRTVYFVWYKKQKAEQIFKSFPGLKYIIVFWFICFLSIFNTRDELLAFKYLLRPIMFFYLVFVLLPVNLIKTKKFFEKILYLIFANGILISISGLISVIFSQGSFLERRASFSPIFGLNLLAGNHNALAEILIVCIPVGFILYKLQKNIKIKNWLIIGQILMIATLLLTFSRSGWLALLVEILVLLFLSYRQKYAKFFVASFITLLILIILVLYFALGTNIAQFQGSTSSRLMMTEISWSYFLDNPMIGNGLNSFMESVGRTFVYTVEYGDPLDSHGVLQKVLTETGLLGLISFVGFVICLFNILRKYYQKIIDENKKVIVTLLIAMAVGVLFFQLFSTSYYLAKIWLPIGLALVGAQLFSKKSQ